MHRNTTVNGEIRESDHRRGNLPLVEIHVSRLDGTEAGATSSVRFRCERVAQLAGLLLIVFGAMALLGWLFSVDNLRDIFPGMPPMMPGTSLGFLLTGCGLWLLSRKSPGQFAVRTAQVCALLVLVAGTLLVVEYLFDWRVFLRRFAWPSSGGIIAAPPSFLSALHFMLFGAALWFEARRRDRFRFTEFCVITGTLMSLLALLGYACGVRSFYEWASVFDGRGIALEAAILFAVLGVGLLSARPERGLMKILTSSTASGAMARSLILAPVLIPFATGLLKNFGLRAGIYNAEVASWLFAFLNIFLFTGAIVWSATLLYRSEMEQQATRKALQQSNSDLEHRVTARTAELSAAESKFRGLVEQSLVGIYVIQDGRFAYVNPKMAAIFGYSQEELTSRPLRDFIFEADRDLVGENVRKRLEGTVNSIRYFIRAVRKDGTVIHVEAHGSRSEFNGQPAVLGTLLDVTESKQAETALRESEERYRLLVENSSELVCEVTLDGRFIYTSPNYRTLLGYDPGELLHTSVFTHVHPEDVPLVAPKFNEMRATGCYRYRDKSGAWRWMESSGRRFTTSAGEERAVIVTRDITESRKLEEQLLQSHKMEAIGTLAGGIAHDFNNILTAVIGNAELLDYDWPENQPGREAVQEILNAAARARDLVRRILTFSRKQPQQRVVTQLQPIVLEVASLLRASLPSTIEIEKRIEADCSTVLADPIQVHQIVMNLATNAAYAMREGGGRLFIGLSCFQSDADFARAHPPLREAAYVRLEVTDTGCGMDAATLKRIFEPFFTTKPVGEGTGLGLSAVHGIMQNHDGLVTVYSEPGKGTTFHLFFPVVSGVSEESCESKAAPPRGRGQRILCVDDEPVIANLADAMLRRSGYVPVVFHSAEEALAAFRQTPNSFDAVVTDLTMPQMTGVVLAEQLRQVRVDVPIVLTTGYSAMADAKRAQEIGVRHLIAKPFSLQTLAKALEQALDAKSETASL